MSQIAAAAAQAMDFTARARACALPPEVRHMAKVTVITSGKGGVGKTTSAASIAAGLALAGKKTAVIDFDVGLRNLDLVMGCERRVVYDLVNVVKGEATVRQ